jgi:hypothetical protein
MPVRMSVNTYVRMIYDPNHLIDFNEIRNIKRCREK